VYVRLRLKRRAERARIAWKKGVAAWRQKRKKNSSLSTSNSHKSSKNSALPSSQTVQGELSQNDVEVLV
jgi:hypothetical protein